MADIAQYLRPGMLDILRNSYHGKKAKPKPKHAHLMHGKAHDTLVKTGKVDPYKAHAVMGMHAPRTTRPARGKK